MPAFRSGTVTAILQERRGWQRVEVDDEKAYVLTELIGPVAVGDRVVMNTTAVDLELGTGGWHVVHWNLSRDAWTSPPTGREMKLRYTSLQADVAIAAADVLPAVPVVVCVLHSQIAAVATAFAMTRPGGRLVYVMTDGGALPIAMSDLVAALRESESLTGTVTAGQAFGGDREATGIDHALAVAGTLEPDAIVVGIGPGALGTGSRLAFPAREVATVLGASLDPILAVRYSDADPRPRHQGISHHTRSVVELSPPGTIAVPAR